MKPRSRKVYITAILLIAAAVAFLIGKSVFFSASSQEIDSPTIKFEAKDFSLKSPYDESTISLDDFAGKNLVVNFFNTWCVSCRNEMPNFVGVWTRYEGTDVEFLGVNTEEDEETVRKFAKEMGINFPIGIDSQGETLFKYGVRVVPTTVFINKKGMVVYVYEGPLTKKQLVSFIEYTKKHSEELA